MRGLGNKAKHYEYYHDASEQLRRKGELKGVLVLVMINYNNTFIATIHNYNGTLGTFIE